MRTLVDFLAVIAEPYTELLTYMAIYSGLLHKVYMPDATQSTSFLVGTLKVALKCIP